MAVPNGRSIYAAKYLPGPSASFRNGAVLEVEGKRLATIAGTFLGDEIGQKTIPGR